MITWDYLEYVDFSISISFRQTKTDRPPCNKRAARTLISLRIAQVWSESSLPAFSPFSFIFEITEVCDWLTHRQAGASDLSLC